MDFGFIDIAVSAIFIFTIPLAMPCPISDGVVNMTKSGLKEVNSSTFAECNNLYGNITKVDLSHNDIAYVHPESFKRLYNLEDIDLSYNQIDELDNSAFENMLSLKVLDCSYNNFKTLKAGLLHESLFSLSEVSFLHNNISEVEWGFVNDNHENLVFLDLKNNSLTSFDPWPYLVKWTGNTSRRDRIFDLQHNKITNINNPHNWTFDLTYPYEVEVRLMFNELTSLSPETFQQFWSGAHEENIIPFFLTFYMNATNNPFFCDCNVYLFARNLRDSGARWRDVEEHRYRCDSPAEIEGEDWLHDVPLHYLVCNITANCPTNCFCQKRPHNNTLLIDCKGAGLSELPDIPDAGDYDLELLFDDNSIGELKNVSYLDQIYNISLNNNRVRELKSETIKQMTRVKQLDLRRNRIDYLPNAIQRLEYGTVQLAGNPLKCGCNALWLSDWVKLDQENGDLSVQCQDDSGNQHRLIDLNLVDMGCTKTYIIVVAVIGAVVVGLVVVALVFAKRCPYETKVILYKIFRIHPEDKYKIDTDEDFTKDIYVSYDNEDVDVRKWIMDTFVEKLNHKKPFYSIMIPFIHFEAGEKHEQIDRWICKSKRVVIILSENYFENEDCEMEIMCATDEQHKNPDKFGKIIYIFFNKNTSDIIQRKINEEPWKTRLADKKLLSPDDKLFWSKIRYELPTKTPRQEPEDYIMARRKKVESPQKRKEYQQQRENLRQRTKNFKTLSPEQRLQLVNQFRRKPSERFKIQKGPIEESAQLELQNEVEKRSKCKEAKKPNLSSVFQPEAGPSKLSGIRNINIIEHPNTSSAREDKNNSFKQLCVKDIFGTFE